MDKRVVCFVSGDGVSKLSGERVWDILGIHSHTVSVIKKIAINFIVYGTYF